MQPYLKASIIRSPLILLMCMVAAMNSATGETSVNQFSVCVCDCDHDVAWGSDIWKSCTREQYGVETSWRPFCYLPSYPMVVWSPLMTILLTIFSTWNQEVQGPRSRTRVSAQEGSESGLFFSHQEVCESGLLHSPRSELTGHLFCVSLPSMHLQWSCHFHPYPWPRTFPSYPGFRLHAGA